MSPALQLGATPDDPVVLERTPVRVTYRDTDQMGHVYYSHYLVWFEMGRTEWLRSRGGCYKEWEARGLYLPVAEAWADYQQPAYYDDLLEIVTWIADVRRASVAFGYEIRCPAREALIARGYTRHAFVNHDWKIVAIDRPTLDMLKTGRPVGGPATS